MYMLGFAARQLLRYQERVVLCVHRWHGDIVTPMVNWKRYSIDIGACSVVVIAPDI
jgi:hypothetical protein